MKRFPGFLAILLPAVLAGQQERVLSGEIRSAADSLHLQGVWIGLVGSKAAAVSDSGGHFSLRLPAGPVRLTFRRIGMIPDTVAVSGEATSLTIYARAIAVRLDPLQVEGDLPPARARFDTLAQPSIMTLSSRELTRAPALLE